MDEAALVARLEQFVTQWMNEAATPGVAVALTDRTRTLHILTSGYADLAARLPVASETLFEIGSIGKSFTAIALLREVERGHIDLHAPVERYLPWFHVPSAFAPITVHHLLSHTAGILTGADFVPSAPYEVYALREQEATYPPGERFHYSNVGYKALGYLLETVTGRQYGTILQEEVLDPIGLRATDAITTHETRKRLALGYMGLYDDRPARRADPLIPVPWLEYNAGDGSPATTAGDLALYLRALLNRGALPEGRLLSEASFALLAQRVIQTMDQRFYGYGLFLEEVEGHQVIGHGGGTVGYLSVMLGDLDAGLGVVVLLNGPGNPSAIGRFALALLRAAHEGQSLPEVPPPDDPTRVENAADYAGTYQSGAKTLTLAAEGTRLLLQYGGATIVLERRGPDAFLVDHPDFALHLLRFSRQDGQVSEACYGEEWYPGERYVGPMRFEAPPDWSAYPGHYRSHNPWASNFRVVLRKGGLILCLPRRDEVSLVPAADGIFRLGDAPEQVRFDTIVQGRTLRANFSGGEYYRQSGL